MYLIAALAGSGRPRGLMQGVTRARRSNTGDRACNVSPIKAKMHAGSSGRSRGRSDV